MPGLRPAAAAILPMRRASSGSFEAARRAGRAVISSVTATAAQSHGTVRTAVNTTPRTVGSTPGVSARKRASCAKSAAEDGLSCEPVMLIFWQRSAPKSSGHGGRCESQGALVEHLLDRHVVDERDGVLAPVGQL